MKRQIFKAYTQAQPMLLPPRLEELIPEGHLVRVVNEMIEELDLEPLARQYKGGGTSAYHPKMMLKVMIYAYTQRTFSSRQIAKALRENINYLWLSDMNQPDHRTINRFRGEIMKSVVEEIFYGVIEQLLDRGYIDLERYFVDGTKIEANANKYSFVWRKSTQNYKAGLQQKVRTLLSEIDEIEVAEEEAYGEKDLAEEDQYVCPQEKKLSYLYTKKYVSDNGYESSRRIYECSDCQGCPVKSECTKAKYNRRIEIGVELLKMKKTAHDNLVSPRGKEMRSQRPIEVESVFGRLKQNWGFRRFLLRGKEKVKTEWGILCIAHNIAKAAA